MTETRFHTRHGTFAGTVRAPAIKPIAVSRVILVQLPVAGLLLAMLFAAAWLDVPVTAFTREATAIADIHPLNGLATKLGATVWAATAGIALFTAILCRTERERRGLFLYFGALTTLLVLDDMFRLHDTLAPGFLPLVPEEAIYGFYVIVLLHGLVRYRHAIWPRSAPLMAAACMCFAVSVGADAFLHTGSAWVYWLEDGAKLLGIANWCACFGLLAADTLRAGQRSHAPGA